MNSSILRSSAVLLTFGTSALAADVTINEPTNYNASVTVDNVYANANVQIGDTAFSTFTINSGKYVYLPGADGKSSQFKVKWGKVSVTGNSAGFNIGKYNGWGYLNVDDCSSGVTLGRVEVRDGATSSQAGYVEIRLANGRQSDGNWRRVHLAKLLNYRAANKDPLRVLFTGKGAALALNSNSDGNFFYVQNSGAKTVLEAEGGREIVFLASPWFGHPTTMSVLQPESKGILRTQGTCNVVFHNTHPGGEANTCPSYVFKLAHSTNQYEWAHTGMTIVSNSCMLATAVNYALPNGPQTGPICFGGGWGDTGASAALGNPWIDLCGTRQIINGVRNSMPARTYNNVTDLRSVITNSSETAATLTVRNEADETFRVGYLKERIALRKEGAGSLGVSGVRMSRNDIEVTAGEFVLSNMWTAVTAGTVSVTGGKLIVDGCTLDCTSISTTGTGAVALRNGGKITGADVSNLSIEVEATGYAYVADGKAYVAETQVFRKDDYFDGCSGLDALSVVKTGAHVLTYVPGANRPGGIEVREGTMRVGGQFSGHKLWKFTVTKTTPSGTISTTDDDPNSATYGQSIKIKPDFAIGRFHMIGKDMKVVNQGMGYQGKDVALASLDSAKSTVNMANALVKGIGGPGGSFGGVLTLFGTLSNWYVGVGFTNSAPISAQNPFALTMRLGDAADYPVGYVMSSCVNYDGSRPQEWTLEYWEDSQWKLADQRSVSDGFEGGSAKSYSHDGVPYLFTALKNNWYFQPTGPVKVDGGATLDLSELPPENISINKLEIDAVAKGGTISNAVLATVGTISLVNATEPFDKPTDTGLTFAQSEGLENVRNWTVSVEGQPDAGYVARIRKGKLYVGKPNGTIIIFK